MRLKSKADKVVGRFQGIKPSDIAIKAACRKELEGVDDAREGDYRRLVSMVNLRFAKPVYVCNACGYEMRYVFKGMCKACYRRMKSPGERRPRYIYYGHPRSTREIAWLLDIDANVLNDRIRRCRKRGSPVEDAFYRSLPGWPGCPDLKCFEPVRNPKTKDEVMVYEAQKVLRSITKPTTMNHIYAVIKAAKVRTSHYDGITHYWFSDGSAIWTNGFKFQSIPPREDDTP